jgi:nitrite reductase (cytochrome c-552)
MSESTTTRNRRTPLLIAAVFFGSLLATVIVVFVLVRMFEQRQDAQTRFMRVAELSEVSTNPRPWGLNWPHHFDQYLQTAGDKFYGGSEALPESKLELHPWLKRLYAGYAFSIDHREARGHAYMLYDQVVTERVHQRPQAGACLHCHASTTVLYRKAGLEAMGQPADAEDLARSFNMPAVIKGFEVLSTKPYHDVLAMLTQVPDGTLPAAEGREADSPVFPAPPVRGFGEGSPQLDEMDPHAFNMDHAHPVSCIDCHDPQTMALRITRPGFVLAMEALAQSEDPLPHMPSIERWRRGNRATPYDPNTMASRQEMRSFTCGQCHVEYYCATGDTLVYPWGKGLKAEQMEAFWEERTFPDGSEFYDYKHAETGALLFKAQHPEFEMWSQGIHARAGVSCADCHMAYERQGAMKLSNHNVRSPMENINNACQTCHNVPERELRDRVLTIQDRTVAMRERAGIAMTEMLDDIVAAKEAGVSDEDLAAVYALQRKGMWRLDFVSSENSRGFHAGQESARILAESIDYSRQAQIEAIRLRRAAQ